MQSTKVGRSSVAAAGALLLLAPAVAWAGGAWLYEVGSPDLGTAGAGRAALAADASTAFGNPAGMTRLRARSCSSACSR